MTLAAVPPARGDQALAADEADVSELSDAPAQKARSSSLGKITTRPSVAEDSAFMLELFASTQKDALENLGWSIGDNRTFVIMQAQTEEYNRARLYPGMDRLTICVDEMSIGRLLVCLRNNILHLVDISLLPRFRGLGIGTQLVSEILDEARNARVPVKLRVRKDSSAVRFFERLGFGTPTDLAQYVELTWMPPLTAVGPDAREDGFGSHGARAHRAPDGETCDGAGVVDSGHDSGHDKATTADDSVAPSEPAPPIPQQPGPAQPGPEQPVAEPVHEAPGVPDEPVAAAPAETDADDETNEDGENPNSDVNQAVLAYVSEADTEYLAEPVWLAPEVVVEEEPEVEEEEEPEVEEDPEVVARREEYIAAVAATDAFTSSFTTSFSAEVAEDDAPDETENLPYGADRYDPFA